MADLKVRSPYPSSSDPTDFPLLLLEDQGDGTYAPKVVGSGTVAKRVHCPWPNMADPTQFVDIGLADNGDGTYSPPEENRIRNFREYRKGAR